MHYRQVCPTWGGHAVFIWSDCIMRKTSGYSSQLGKVSGNVYNAGLLVSNVEMIALVNDFFRVHRTGRVSVKLTQYPLGLLLCSKRKIRRLWHHPCQWFFVKLIHIQYLLVYRRLWQFCNKSNCGHNIMKYSSSECVVGTKTFVAAESVAECLGVEVVGVAKYRG